MYEPCAHLQIKMCITGKKPEEHYPFAVLPDEKLYGMLYPMCDLHLLHTCCQPALDASKSRCNSAAAKPSFASGAHQL